MIRPRTAIWLTCALLAACGASPDSNSMALEGPDWELATLFGAPCPTDAGPTPWIRFDADPARVHGSSGINQFNGGYERDGASLDLGALAMTRRAGPPAAMELEMKFVQALEQTRAWAGDADGLRLIGEGDEELATFRRR